MSESKSEMIELVLPNDTNPLGALLGGRLMHWIDLAGALAAHRHSHSYAVTASMDHIDFLVPVHVGDMVILQSAVNRAFHTSMEVGVRVLVENYISGSRQKVATAYLTFVAVDRHGRSCKFRPSFLKPKRRSAVMKARCGVANPLRRNASGGWPREEQEKTDEGSPCSSVVSAGCNLCFPSRGPAEGK